MTAIETKIRALEFEIQELKRKARGTTTANGRVASLERSVDRLKARLDAIGEIPAGSNVQFESVLQEIARLNTQAGDVNAELARLHEQDQGHYRDLQGQVTMVSNDLGEVDRRVGDLENSDVHRISFRNSRVETEGEGTVDVRTPWGEALIVGLLAGGLTALALNLWFAQDWPSGKDFAAAVIVGVSAFFIMASFEKLSVRLNISNRIVWAEHPRPEAEAELSLEQALAELPPPPSADDHTDIHPVVH